jgi:hypothetical protein
MQLQAAISMDINEELIAKGIVASATGWGFMRIWRKFVKKQETAYETDTKLLDSYKAQIEYLSKTNLELMNAARMREGYYQEKIDMLHANYEEKQNELLAEMEMVRGELVQTKQIMQTLLLENKRLEKMLDNVKITDKDA